MYMCVNSTTISILKSSITPKHLLVLSLWSHTLLPPLTSDNNPYLSVALWHSFVFSRMSYKWHHTECNLLHFLKCKNLLLKPPLLSAMPSINLYCCMYQCIIHFYCWEVLCLMDMPKFIHSSTGSLSGFVTKVGIKVCVEVFVWIELFIFKVNT